MTKVIELNCETGEQTERPMTAEEIAQREAAIEISAAQQAQKEAEDEAKAEARASALVKLAALGLTPEEIAAL